MTLDGARDTTSRALFGLSTAVIAQREGKILILKRAAGEVTGGWYLPGGAVEAGEDVEAAARRELFEESGLTPGGPLTLIGVARMEVYGADTLQVTYACDCPDGDVVLSDEHSGARWIEAHAYRERYFGDDLLAAVDANNARIGALMRAARGNIDRYIAWRAHEFLDNQLRVMRLSADVFVLRDGQMLLLKRSGGIGDGVWYLPGGIVEPGEDPRDAAARETHEEVGLRIAEPELLRVWSYPAQNGVDAFHASFAAMCPDGDVVLSHEHSDFRWMPPLEYAERYCGEQVAAAAPQWATWLRQVRRNCELAAAWLQRQG
jgi:8-oxo-dGTP diphosphatase